MRDPGVESAESKPGQTRQERHPMGKPEPRRFQNGGSFAPHSFRLQDRELNTPRRAAVRRWVTSLR